MLKLGAVTVRVTLGVCWMPPPFPVTVMRIGSQRCARPHVMVVVEFPEPGGTRLRCRPALRRRRAWRSRIPEADRLIALLNPPLIDNRNH